MLPNLRQWVPFSSFFGHRILGGSTRKKTKHEDTKTPRIPIPARDAQKWFSLLCLRVLPAEASPSSAAGKVGRNSERFASTEPFLHEADSGIRLNSSAMNKSGKNPNDR
jgi:hypothetical protein